MSSAFTYSEKVPTKEQLKMLSNRGKENVKNNKTFVYFNKYNQFKKDAIANLQYAKDTVFITGETQISLNEYDKKDKKECQMYKEFTERFNNEKITNVELFYKDCEMFFDWSK